ncbi:MAG: amino acid adenylation domain-containing protein [Bacillota bacterium]
MILSNPQKSIYQMDKFIGGSASNICGSMLIGEGFTNEEIVSTINELLIRNDTLRIRIDETEIEPTQYIVPYEQQEIETLKFQKKSEFQSYVETYAKTPISLEGNLCEMKVLKVENQWGVLGKVHHIIGDAWTFSFILSQLLAILNGEEVETYPYFDYIETEKKYMESKRYQRDKEFFIDQFKRCDETIYLNNKQVSSYKSNRITMTIGTEDTKKIAGYVASVESSNFALLMATLGIYMSRIHMNAEKFYIGMPVLNRSTPKEKNTMGIFINSVPMLIELSNETSFKENLFAVMDSSFSLFRHQKFNYNEVLSAIRQEFQFTEKLYDVVFSYQNAKVNPFDMPFKSEWHHCGEQSESLQIHVDDRDNEGILTIHYDYLVEKFSEKEIRHIHEGIFSLLFDGIANDTKKIYEMEIMSAEEKQKVLHEFSDTILEYDKEKCIHHLFEEQVKCTPNSVALIASDKTFTYDELDKESNKIANMLIGLGIKTGDIVTLLLNRDSHLICTILGVLKSGAAYMALDPSYPHARIKQLISTAQSKLIVTKTDNLFTHADIELLYIDKNYDAHSDSSPNITQSSETLFCALHTSGSTGTPKTAGLLHRSMHNFYSSTKGQFENTEHSFAITTVAFDVFVQDTILYLLGGGTCVLFDESTCSNQVLFEKMVTRYRKGFIFCTPTKLYSFIKNSTDKAFLKHINTITVGGEIFNADLYKSLEEYYLIHHSQNNKKQIYNEYAPAEANIGVIIDHVLSSDIKLGKPIANTQIYIVDKFMQLVPIGVPGELFISGDNLGCGYINQPQLTDERFIPNVFRDGIMYKSGDSGSWNDDGSITFHGRLDHQVKIRGLRIEMGEIEANISDCDGVTEACVVEMKDDNKRQYICAFYTGEPLDMKEIKKHISKNLPQYMIPHFFIHLNEFPTTTSGKINRNLLQKPDFSAVQTEVEYAPPTTLEEKCLCDLYADVLNISKVGIDDNFFDLGGDSLKAIELVAKAHHENLELKLQAIFDAPTVRELCGQIVEELPNYTEEMFIKSHGVIAKELEKASKPPEKINLGNAMFTGVTGFLGVHLLAEFLDNHEGKAFCLVRGATEEICANRLRECLQFYFDNRYDGQFGKRIFVVKSDLLEEKLGIADEVSLSREVDTIFHSAATVKHYGTYDYFHATNVASTQKIIDFARFSKARLMHISTLSVSGLFLDNGQSEEKTMFKENHLYIGQNLENVYLRSKFEAEKLVLEAVADGLEANIFRMGNLTNRLSDLKFQPNFESNSFLNRVKALLNLGMIPDYLLDVNVEFSPIDSTAKAVMTIAGHHNNERTIFHINNGNQFAFRELIASVKKIDIDLKVVTSDEFIREMNDTMNDEQTRYIYETLIHECDAQGKLMYDTPILTSNESTVNYLNKLGFFWGKVTDHYIKDYINYFERIGYMEVL